MFPQHPLSLSLSSQHLSSKGSLLSLPILSSSHLSHHFSEEKLLGQKRAQEPCPQPGRPHCQIRRDLLLPFQTACLRFQFWFWGGKGTYTGSLVLGAKPFCTELALDLPGEEGRALPLELGDSRHHRRRGQAWLASPNPLGLQDTCAVVTP